MTPEMIDAYERGPATVRAAVAGLTRDELTARPGPGAWSIHEIVIHLLDSDSISIDRMKRILIEVNPPLLYADETAYVEKLHTHDQDLEDALVLFELGRRQFARVLRKLTPTDFDRYGTHNRKGRVTVEEMVKSYIEHIDDHMTYILKKRITLGKPLPEDRS